MPKQHKWFPGCTGDFPSKDCGVWVANSGVYHTIGQKRYRGFNLLRIGLVGCSCFGGEAGLLLLSRNKHSGII